MDCNPPHSSIHGILQARILEWVAISFSRGSSQPRRRTQVYCIAGRCFNLWASPLPWHVPICSWHDYAYAVPIPPVWRLRTPALGPVNLALHSKRASPVAHQLKNPLAIQELEKIRVQSLGWEDPLEEKMETQYSILARKILWTGRLQSKGSQSIKQDWARTQYHLTVMCL